MLAIERPNKLMVDGLAFRMPATGDQTHAKSKSSKQLLGRK